MGEVAITRAGSERIDELEPLWQAMHAHHRSVAGHLEEVAAFRSAEESWGRRRAHYERVLAEPDTFLLLAERGLGLGGRLLDEVYAELRRRGIDELSLAVMEGNDDALRFYARRGLVPYLTFLIGPVPPESP